MMSRIFIFFFSTTSSLMKSGLWRTSERREGNQLKLKSIFTSSYKTHISMLLRVLVLCRLPKLSDNKGLSSAGNTQKNLS